MNAFMIQQAASVGAQPRPRVAVETTPIARRPNRGARQTLGVALVAMGQRVAGELPAGQATPGEGGPPLGAGASLFGIVAALARCGVEIDAQLVPAGRVHEQLVGRAEWCDRHRWLAAAGAGCTG